MYDRLYYFYPSHFDWGQKVVEYNMGILFMIGYKSSPEEAIHAAESLSYIVGIIKKSPNCKWHFFD